MNFLNLATFGDTRELVNFALSGDFKKKILTLEVVDEPFEVVDCHAKDIKLKIAKTHIYVCPTRQFISPPIRMNFCFTWVELNL